MTVDNLLEAFGEADLTGTERKLLLHLLDTSGDGYVCFELVQWPVHPSVWEQSTRQCSKECKNQ